MAEIKAVFFDLDGTLWDRVACSSHVLDLALEKIRPHVPDAAPAQLVSQFNGALLALVRERGLADSHAFARRARFAKMLDLCGIPGEDLLREVTHQFDSARRFTMRKYLRAGAIPLLRELQYRKVTRGLLTNGVPSIQKHVLEKLGLLSYLDHVLIGDVEGFCKPHEGLFQRALQLSGVRPEETLHVGDSLLTDILGASRIGIRTAWLKSPQTSIPEGFPQPDHTIGKLKEVLDIVRGSREAQQEPRV